MGGGGGADGLTEPRVPWCEDTLLPLTPSRTLAPPRVHPSTSGAMPMADAAPASAATKHAQHPGLSRLFIRSLLSSVLSLRREFGVSELSRRAAAAPHLHVYTMAGLGTRQGYGNALPSVLPGKMRSLCCIFRPDRSQPLSAQGVTRFPQTINQIFKTTLRTLTITVLILRRRAPRFGEIKQVAAGQTASERWSRHPDTGSSTI